MISSSRLIRAARSSCTRTISASRPPTTCSAVQLWSRSAECLVVVGGVVRRVEARTPAVVAAAADEPGAGAVDVVVHQAVEAVAARGGGRGRGRGGLGAGFLDQLDLLDVNFKIEKLGAGDVIDTRPTQRYRITTDYRVVWAGDAFPAHAVTEIWTAALPMRIPNPFEPFIVAEQSTDGPLIEYALKLRAIRAQIEGTPIKVITTTTFSAIRDVVGLQSFVTADPTMDKVTVVQQTQLTSIQPAEVDPKLLVVPDSSAN